MSYQLRVKEEVSAYLGVAHLCLEVLSQALLASKSRPENQRHHVRGRGRDPTGRRKRTLMCPSVHRTGKYLPMTLQPTKWGSDTCQKGRDMGTKPVERQEQARATRPDCAGSASARGQHSSC